MAGDAVQYGWPPSPKRHPSPGGVPARPDGVGVLWEVHKGHGRVAILEGGWVRQGEGILLKADGNCGQGGRGEGPAVSSQGIDTHNV